MMIIIDTIDDSICYEYFIKLLVVIIFIDDVNIYRIIFEISTNFSLNFY